MFHILGARSNFRLALALLLSAALHFLLVLLPDWEKRQPLPRPENWRLDVNVAARGEGVSRKPEVPRTEKRHANPGVAAKSLVKAKVPQGAAPVDEPAVARPPSVPSPPEEKNQQAEAMAGAMANLANMQFILNQTRIFQTVSRERIKSAVQAQFTEEVFRQYAGAVCKVELSYATLEKTAEAKVDCGERQALADILSSNINWGSLPQPDKYFLKYHGAGITLWFEGFWVRVGFQPGE